MPRRASYDHLARQLAHHEDRAALVRDVLRQMGGGFADVKGLRALASRLERDRDRDRAPQPRRPAARRLRGLSPGEIARRVNVAHTLAQFDPLEPRRPEDLPIPVSGLAALVRQGYLARTAGGYVRTAKPFFVEPHDK